MGKLERKLEKARCLAEHGATRGERASARAAVVRLEARLQGRRVPLKRARRSRVQRHDAQSYAQAQREYNARQQRRWSEGKGEPTNAGDLWGDNL